jgi:hypothetical protein
MEPERIEYTRTIQLLNLNVTDINKKILYYPRYIKYLKYLVSFIVLILMVKILFLFILFIILTLYIHFKLRL